MTEFNKSKTTAHGLYGNGEETYFVNKHGKMFCVQSPDLRPGEEATLINDNRLPVDCVAFGTRDVEGIEIPDWVYEAK